ncbi:MAG: hypothetical protein ACJ77K_02045 [Bacteroidia bacterium]
MKQETRCDSFAGKEGQISNQEENKKGLGKSRPLIDFAFATSADFVRRRSLRRPKAGSLLQGSNPKKRKSSPNQASTKEGKNSIRFAEDLIKIHEFYKIFIREITAILEKG